jgi:hypothetical protein
MKQYLDNLTVQQIYAQMEVVINSIEKDLRNNNII